MVEAAWQNHVQGFAESDGGSLLITVFALLGLIAAIRSVVRLGRGVWVYVLRPGKNLKRYGSWAVVTGATDGIGRAYAEALAKKGAVAGRRSVARVLPTCHPQFCERRSYSRSLSGTGVNHRLSTWK